MVGECHVCVVYVSCIVCGCRVWVCGFEIGVEIGKEKEEKQSFRCGHFFLAIPITTFINSRSTTDLLL